MEENNKKNNSYELNTEDSRDRIANFHRPDIEDRIDSITPDFNKDYFNEDLNNSPISEQNKTYEQTYQHFTSENTMQRPDKLAYPKFSNLNLDGEHASKTKGVSSFFRGLLSIIIFVCSIFGLAYILNIFVIQPYEIPSGSMETTIMTGDKVMAEKVSYRFSEPQVGDVITFQDPQIASRTLIKRIVAKSGQTIDLQQGKVIVDGQTLDEPYTNGQRTYELATANNVRLTYPYTVPEGYVFVMGDNRENSQDSRYFGPIKMSTIEGHAFLVYWPVDHFGTL